MTTLYTKFKSVCAKESPHHVSKQVLAKLQEHDLHALRLKLALRS